jgi:hypothetical protein
VGLVVRIDDIASVHLDIIEITPPASDTDVTSVAMATVETELSQPSLARPDVGVTENVLALPLGPLEESQSVEVASASRPIRRSKVAGDLVA